MEIIRGAATIPRRLPHPILTIGNFDGVHRGHQQIFAQVVATAAAHQGIAVAYTFDPHPAKVLAPDRPFHLLQTLPQRCAVIGAQGIQTIVIEPFTRDFAHMTPETFFADIIVKHLAPAHLIVGYDFTFGSHRAGRVEQLKAMGHAHRITVDVVEPFFDGETLLSSSYIRQCVREGQMHLATQALGRPYQMTGPCVRGRGIGTQLGFPTMNMVPENELLPPEGIYVATAVCGAHRYPAATYIGRNPTFGGATLVVETYLLNYVGNAAPARIDVDLHVRLRGDIRFDTAEALKTQIAQDVAAAHRYHAQHPSDT